MATEQQQEQSSAPPLEPELPATLTLASTTAPATLTLTPTLIPTPTLQEKQTTTGTKESSTLSGPFVAVRPCMGLQHPAIFLGTENLPPIVGPGHAADHRTFYSLEDATQWLHEGPNPKSRKRKASLTLGRSAIATATAIATAIPTTTMISQRQEQNNQKWEEKFEELVRFTETIGDGDPNLALSKEYRQPELADFLRHQRQDYNAFVNHKVPEKSTVDRKTRYLRLLQIGVRLQPEKTFHWPQQAQKWKEYMQEHPEAQLSETSSDATVVELAIWQNRQIEEYIKMVRKEIPHEMYPHRVQQLKAWKFPFPKDVPVPKKILKTFEERVEEFIQWKEANNSPLVPQSVRGLGEWVKEQRKEYRKFAKGEKAYITAERVEMLKGAGFVFDVRKKSNRHDDTNRQ